MIRSVDRPRMSRRRRIRRQNLAAAVALSIAATLAAVPLTAVPAVGDTSSPQVVAVNGASPGRTFDGIGVESAGAATRLLREYPPPQRREILDYLFKPDVGANLQQLKVEIGGDMNSTDGAEPSHMRTPNEVDCDRGYEWWLMEEAKKRNPNILLSGVQWGGPAWVGNGENTLWTQNNIDYLLSWLNCAKQHGLHIDHVGGWTERGFNVEWLKSLRHALDENGYGDVEILSDEGFGWHIADQMAADPEFKNTVDIVGVHYPCGFPSGSNCPSTPTAKDLGKPLWASELTNAGFGQNYDFLNAPAGALAGEFNRVYIDGQMTASFVWNVVWSAYDGLPFAAGLIKANKPWSGNYSLGKSLWAVAHTTQFAQPGWKYLDEGSSRLAGGGSVVTLRAPGDDNWSSIVETKGASAPQNLQFQISGGLSSADVHVWATNMQTTTSSDSFQRLADIRPVDGRINFTAEPGYVYSFTTTRGQGQGSVAPRVPQDTVMRMPYRDNFESYRDGTTPAYFSDLGGAFEAQPCSPIAGMTRNGGSCLVQQIVDAPVEWAGFDRYPSTLIGDTRWTNYRVSVDAVIPSDGHTELVGRAMAPQIPFVPGFADGIQGYHLRIAADGTWSLFREGSTGTGANSHRVDTPLASGTEENLSGGTVHRLSLAMHGGAITAFVDGARVAVVQDATYGAGQAALALSGWVPGQFDNFEVEALRN